jgi:hypothetical protein
LLERYTGLGDAKILFACQHYHCIESGRKFPLINNHRGFIVGLDSLNFEIELLRGLNGKATFENRKKSGIGFLPKHFEEF